LARVPATPRELQLPHVAWRTDQAELIQAALDSKAKVTFIEAPTGAGKSTVALSIALLYGKKAAIVTQTKSLQKQYIHEYNNLRLNYLIGRDNYRCLLDPLHFSVSEAPCNTGWKCPMIMECDYFKTKINAAKFNSPIITNYSYLLGESQTHGVLSDLDILILDEGHEAENALMDFVKVELDQRDCKKVGVELENLPTIEAYQKWATMASSELHKEIVSISKYITDNNDPFGDIATLRRLRLLKQQLSVFSKMLMVDDDWIIERNKNKSVTFRPLWVKKYGKYYTSIADKIIIQSATIVNPGKMADLLGIYDWDYLEVDSTFDPKRRPFYFWPVTSVRYSMPDSDTDLLIQAVDKIIEKHQGERGIIHTVNYALRDSLLLRSHYSRLMLTHNPQNREEVIENFLQEKGHGSILVSPSVTSGLNAPYHRCSFQIILKVPFADQKELQTKLRMKEDPEWYAYNAASDLVQAYGRAMRYDDDYGVTYMLDNNFLWFFRENFEMFPRFFREAVRRINAL
jgi:Rad3-related DNA helicase